MRRALQLWLATCVVALAVPLTLSVSASVASASTSVSCHAPRLTGLTVTNARSRAKVARCALRLIGAKLKVPQVQTIRSQNVRPGQVTRTVTLTVNPLCGGAALSGPPPGEPFVTSGPTELISGLFLEGGPFVDRSAPNCKEPREGSSAGTITVTNSAGTDVVEGLQLSSGQLMYLKVPAGKYIITGVVSENLKVGPLVVNVPAGKTVRQDLTADVP